MKNGSITEQISIHEKIFASEKENMQIALYTDGQIVKDENEVQKNNQSKKRL